MAGPYNIDETLAPEDPDYYPWHEGVAAAVNDLHTRAAALESGKADASAAVPKSLVDAKGDLLVGTAADTLGRVAVGSNGQVLTADSAQASGVKWATPSGGGGGLPATVNTFQDKMYSGGVQNAASGLSVVDIIMLTPILLAAGLTLKRIIVGVNAAASVSQSFDVGVYDMAGDLLAVGTGSTGTSTGNKEVSLASAVALDPGMYWFALKVRESSADSTLKFNSYDPGQSPVQTAYLSRGNGWDAIFGGPRRAAVAHAGTGALPASIASLTVSESGPSIGFGWRVE